MTIEEVRAILWPKYQWVPDEALIAFVDLIESVSYFVVTMENEGQDNWIYTEKENHDP